MILLHLKHFLSDLTRNNSIWQNSRWPPRRDIMKLIISADFCVIWRNCFDYFDFFVFLGYKNY